MALVNVVNMVVLDNPCNFQNPFQFEITFECLQELEDDLEWKVLYVGSAHDATKDQVLDEILVGPVPVGINKFVLQADAPMPNQLPPDDILGVTVVLVTCSYKEREFVRVGYYVNNELEGYNAETDGPPPSYPELNLDRVQRQILADKPRVTKFHIQWDTTTAAAAAPQAISAIGQLHQETTGTEDSHASSYSNQENHLASAPSGEDGVASAEAQAKMAAAMDSRGMVVAGDA